MTYDISNEDKVQDVASQLRSDIITTFQQSDSLRWPPSAHNLEEMDNVVPASVIKSLRCLSSGRDEAGSRKVNRLVRSFGEDLCRATTKGQWKLPKHIWLCMTFRYLYRSSELVTRINRFGHSENYSFSFEFENALAISVQESSQMLTSQIVRHPGGESLFHSDFDSFDQNTASSSIHTPHGIMLQEVEKLEETSLSIPEVYKSVQQGLHLRHTTNQLPDCFVSTRKCTPYDITRWTCPVGIAAENTADQWNMLWLFARWISSSTNQEVPGWSGFISVTGVEHSRITIDYYPVINCPINDYKTVQECQRYSEQATHELGLEYVVITFDFGVCMKAYPWLWNNPVRYQKHIVMIGSFHAVWAYIKMLAKRCKAQVRVIS